MWFILVTLDTSHLERSPLNDGLENNKVMSITAETSQDPIGPCGPLEQSVGDSWRHCTIAACSSAFEYGENPVAAYYCMRYMVGVRVRFRAGELGIGGGLGLEGKGECPR